MTPFGLRNKLKSILGRSGQTERVDERVPLTFTTPDGTVTEVQSELRYTLVMASQTLEKPIATGCPDGHCGHCIVDVLDATGLGEPSPAEAKLLAEKTEKSIRLACHARVVGPGAKIKVREVWSMDSVRGE
ncbi:MAG: 2Fe-2S iron-sulfur cluster binding domain-containing protein [Myxococcales bacterium]|nr:2Fe-2S iron-sulfur cluster binding domain-containing protein [Myxococcales bacterium]